MKKKILIYLFFILYVLIYDGLIILFKLYFLDNIAGLGIMSIPYCFKIGGAIPSIVFLFILGFTARYTARLISKCIEKDKSINSLAIMGLRVFGKTGCTIISTFFIFDLFFSMMANLILVKDTLHLIFPVIPPYICLLIAYACCVYLTWIKKLVTLSWVSLVGLLSMFALFLILVFNGIVTPNAPGSLLERQELNLWPESFLGFCTIIGIFEMGFSVHSGKGKKKIIINVFFFFFFK